MKKLLLLIFFPILFLLFFVFFLWTKEQNPETHFVIIPHFMLASEKVDQFYAFLKDKRYAERSPDMIVIISPNHYHQHSTSPQTICETSDIYFKNKKYTMTPFPNVACDEEIFYPFGNGLTTREHGIGEHLQRITTYFPDTKQIIPLILPTHREPPQVAYPPAKAKRSEVVQNCGREGAPQDCGAGGGLINKEILFIASVDFSHYLPETTALANDKTSISTLQSWTWTRSDFRALDVDCPACLFTIQQLTAPTQQYAQLRYRDSSSTIFGRDMEKENTSRVFMRYQ